MVVAAAVAVASAAVAAAAAVAVAIVAVATVAAAAAVVSKRGFFEKTLPQHSLGPPPITFGALAGV